MGIVILPLIGLYLLLLVWATRRGWRWAQNCGWQGRKRWLGAAYGFLIVYLPVFWDWIPTVAMHQYYCATEAGFWVYKTPEQWKKENPGVMEGLIDSSPQKYPSWPTEVWNGKKIDSINQRFGLLYTDHLVNSGERELFLHQWRWRTELLDKKTGDILARYIDFSSGNGFVGGEPELRFWLHNNHCSDGINSIIKFSGFIKQFRGMQ
jgi:hypothetical protein